MTATEPTSPKLTQSVTKSLHGVADALALLQQLRQRRILDHFEHAVGRNAAFDQPVAGAGLKLFGNIPSCCAAFLELLQPLQFFCGALQCPALDDNLRRRCCVETETALCPGPRQITDPFFMSDLGVRLLLHVCKRRDCTVQIEATLF